MRVSRWGAVGVAVLILQVGCGKASHLSGSKISNTSTASSGGGGTSYTSDPALETQALSILRINCSGCHGSGISSGGVTDILNVSHLISSGLIVPGNPSAGRIVGAIQGGTMPPAGPLPASSLATIQAWIASMTVTTDGTTPPPPPPPPVVLEPTWTSISKNILEPKCVSCHGAVAPKGGVRYDSYSAALSKGKIVPGNANNSTMYKEVNSGSMPPAANGYPPLTSAELTVIRDWINMGAMNN